MRDVRAIVWLTPGPAWNPALSFGEQAGIEAHRAHYRYLEDDGKVYGLGPFVDGGGGALVVGAAGVGEAELRAVAQADPAVVSGVLVPQIRTWSIRSRR